MRLVAPRVTSFATRSRPASFGEAGGSYEIPALSLRPLLLRRSPIWKRYMDIVGSSLALTLFSPLMLAVAVAIVASSGWPVLFRQQRAGLGGRPFTMFKFRSMVPDAERRKEELLCFNERCGPVFKMADDPRVTPVGRFIRKWSLDELPQLFNVLKGDMSLVGPRPPTLDEVGKYRSWQDRRLDIKPGVTCLWQVYARHRANFEEWVRLDIEYARRVSFLVDMKILLLTLPAVLSRKGAC